MARPRPSPGTRSVREGRHDLAVPLYRGLLKEQPETETTAVHREIGAALARTRASGADGAVG